jgi:protein-tyrosine-phosphatase/tRNA A37 threonylcarbamoyladenosine synthetase subunit TsaC/SUA5/YrdC
MPEVIDWNTRSTPSWMERVVPALRSGKTVALPTEAGYVLGASALVPGGVARLHSAGASAALPALAVRKPLEVREWVVDASPLGQRLARRFWPGHLALAFPTRGQASPLAYLADEVRDAVGGEEVRLWAPQHPVLAELLAVFPGPLVLETTPLHSGTSPETHSDDLLGACGERVDLLVDAGPLPSAHPPTVVRLTEEGWTVLRPGVISEEVLQQQSACIVVFICTGNTCRSPLAEVLFKKKLADRLGCASEDLPGRGFFVLSAGLSAMIGGAAAAEAIEVAQQHGADLMSHRSQPLSSELAARADYLVVMTYGHLRELGTRYAQLGTRPRLLNPLGVDLDDPIGQPRPVYEDCARQIWQDLDTLLAEVHSEGMRDEG